MESKATDGHGRTREERQQVRQHRLEQLLAAARADALIVGRTITCRRGDHEACKGERPKNSGCLCECHDPA